MKIAALKPKFTIMKKVLYLFVLLSCFSLRAYCQGNGAVLQNIVSKLKTLSTDHIIEKAYLHFDKPYYAAGDTMYFKAYVTLGERHDLSKVSGILYVELITPQNTIANSIKLQLIDGVGWGDFTLPNTLTKGNYRVRAYTRYMENDPEYFFDQIFPIGSINNSNVAESSASAPQNSKADIQFFPEGGDMITNLVSRIAFKAIGSNGLGINVKGVIFDNTNAVVSKFSSTHLGMGAFYFEPQEGKTYKAKVTYADGSQNTVDLPKQQPEGIVLAVKDTLDKMSIEIRCNKAYLKDNLNKEVNLVVYSGGMVTNVNTKLDDTNIGMDVPNKNFVSGIVRVTLFSQSGEPISERLLFLQNPDLLNLAVTSNKTTYKNREKVQLSVNAKNSAGMASIGHFSVSVIDEGKVPVDENSENTILTDLLLTGELKGYVEQPNYYFNKGNKQSDLDILMLTQGYRRFSWKKLLDSNYPAFTYHPESAFKVTGQAKMADGSPLATKPILLRAASPSTFNSNIFTEETDAEGKFKFENLIFSDTANLIIQPEISKNKNTNSIIVDGEDPKPVISNNTMPGTAGDVNSTMQVYLDNIRQSQYYNNSVVLKNIKVFENKKALYKTTALSGAGNADQLIRGDEIRDFVTLADALNGRLHGSYISNGVAYLNSARTISVGVVTPEPMLVVLDGVTTSINLNDINPGIVENVELLTNQNASIYGVRGAFGVLVITTKQISSLSPDKVIAKGVVQFKRNGFYKAREFYSPEYENTNLTGQADLRATITWKPELITDKDGNMSFEYYNGDGHGNYRLVIEGIDDKGNIGRQVYRYKVE